MRLLQLPAAIFRVLFDTFQTILRLSFSAGDSGERGKGENAYVYRYYIIIEGVFSNYKIYRM